MTPYAKRIARETCQNTMVTGVNARLSAPPIDPAKFLAWSLTALAARTPPRAPRGTPAFRALKAQSVAFKAFFA